MDIIQDSQEFDQAEHFFRVNELHDLARKTQAKYIMLITCGMQFVCLGFIIAIGIVLELNDHDCDRPIRLWLFVSAINLGEFVLYGLLKFCTTICHRDVCKSTLMIILFIFVCHLLGWFVIGNIWFFDSNCDGFYEGYVMSMTLIIFWYAIFGILLCIVGVSFIIGRVILPN